MYSTLNFFKCSKFKIGLELDYRTIHLQYLEANFFLCLNRAFLTNLLSILSPLNTLQPVALQYIVVARFLNNQSSSLHQKQ